MASIANCESFPEGTNFSTNSPESDSVGRTSVDIIKSGGYKISGLEIESVPAPRRDGHGHGQFGPWDYHVYHDQKKVVCQRL